jgi:CHAT domain-containing protein/uncharacterized protein HemY
MGDPTSAPEAASSPFLRGGWLFVERAVRAGYYLSKKVFLRRRVSPGTCAGFLIAAISFAAAAAQAQTSALAGGRGEFYEKCKSYLSKPAKDLPDSEENNAFLGSCGWKFFDYYEVADAEKAFDQEKQMAERRHDQTKLAEALEGQGGLYREKGDFANAERLLQQALGIDEEMQNKYQLSRLCNSLGRLRGEQNRADEAYTFFLRSLTLAQEINNPLRIAVASNNVATYLQGRGDDIHALDYLQQSLSALEQLNDEPKSTTVLNNIGLSYLSLGDFPKGIEFIQKALAIREKLNDPTLVGKSFDTLGVAYLGQGNYAAALESLQKGLELRTAGGLPRHVADSLNNIAMVYEAQGEYSQAIVYLQRSLAVERKFGDKDLEAEIYTHLGEVHSLEGNYAQASAALQHALQNAQAVNDKLTAVRTQYALGRLYLQQGRLRKAEDTLNGAREYFESAHLAPELAHTLVELSEVERRRGRLQEGMQLATRAKDMGDEMGLPEAQWRSLTTLGRLNATLGHRDEAAKLFEGAITVVEDLRTRVAGGEENRARFFAERVAPYQERIALALAAGKTDDALYYAERSKARVLMDVIGADRVPDTTGMSEDERQREARLRSVLASLNSQVLVEAQANPADEKRLASLKQQREEARLRYEDFESTLYSSRPELALRRGTLSVVRAAETRTLLTSRSASIVEYAVVRGRTWAFVMSSRGIRVFALGVDNSQLRQQVERFRQQLATRDLRIAEIARALYQETLGPAHDLLKDRDELVIIPDGILWDLPFQALRSGADHYLVEDSAISYAPSLTALREMMRPRQRTNQQQTLLAFGNPTIGTGVVGRRKLTLMDERLAPLPAAEVQAKSVAEVYRPDSRVYVRGDAREDRWKAEAPRYRILHLATHGVLDNRSPLYSYLVLTPSDDPTNPEDGLLEAWEIMKMRLNADLVVLSACETARGRISAGEAVIGLTWAFFVAGSSAIVVSQWKVESESSGVLMMDFHQRWQGGRSGLSKARALQTAAVKLLRSRNYSHPFYWAGYILVGDGR